MVFSCKGCNGDFIKRPSDQTRYCSKECKHRVKWETLCCAYCGKAFETLKRYKAKYCSKSCANTVNSTGDKNPFWKGGKTLRNDGYMWKLAPDHPNAIHGRYVLEHRLVVEKSLGRLLEKDEVIHHINGIKLDNRIENLMVLSRKEHIKIHPKCFEARNLVPPSL